MKKYALIIVFAFVLGGCSSSYITPAGGVSVTQISDVSIEELFKREPSSPFPARLAIVRIQDKSYSTGTNSGYGSGAYTVVTARDIESEEDFLALSKLKNVSAVAPLSRLLIPQNADNLKDLRMAAAKLKTDLLLVYSVDTAFNVEGTPLGPLSLISLGFIPNKKAFVSATVSGALIDVRSGYIYGTTEATEKESQLATIWSTREAIDESRVISERKAFKSFLKKYEALWVEIERQYATKG